MKRAPLLLVLAACANNDFVVQPYIDFPTNDGASPYPIDQLTISVAHEGSEIDLVSTTASRGASINLPDIPFADDLVMHMTGRYKGSDVAYGKSCRFELRADARIPVPHIYLSRTVKFGTLSQLPLAREGGVAITYSDGSGLLLGGHPPGANTEGLSQVERFDPNTGEYEVLHDIVKRVGAAVALLGDVADQRVIVIGGVDPATNVGAQFIEVLDADRTTEHQYDMFPDAQMPLIGISATSLTDGRVIAIGGQDPATGTRRDQVIEVTIESGTPIARALRAKLLHPRSFHTATRLGDQVGSPVLVTGGLDDAGVAVAEAELFKPLAEDFTTTFHPKMVVPRWRHQAVRLPDGSVLIIGGVKATPPGDPTNGEAVRTIELFSLDSGFREIGQLPGPAGIVGFSATTLPDGRVLITGGRANGGAEDASNPALNSAYIASLDPFDGTVNVVPTDRLAVARAGHQATLLCDGTVLIAGGTPSQSSYERYNPPAAARR